MIGKALVIGVAWCLTTLLNAQNVIYGNAADANVQEDRTIFSVASNQLLQGGSGVGNPLDRSTIFAFQLPDLGAVAEPFENASFRINLEAKSGTPKATDLYGLGRRVSPTVLTDDYYGETSTADPSDAVRLQTNFLTSSAANGLASTNETGATVLRDYLNAAYEGGVGIGQYVFIRLSTTSSISAIDRYTITSVNGNAADPSKPAPQITYNAPTMGRPFLWVRNSEKQAILDKIANQAWAQNVYQGIINRAASPLASHQADRDAFIRELPVLWSPAPARFKTIPTYAESEVRFPTTAKFDHAIDCAVLYYLTGNEAYAGCAADILHNSIRTLLPVAPNTNVNNGGWIFQSDLLKEARVIGNQLPVVYDFLHTYLQTHQVYDVQTGGMVDFDFTNAQSVFRTYYELTRDHGQLVSNWSALMSNCMLQNLLAFDDETEREAALNIYLTTGTNRQQSLATDYQTFTASGNIWPESLLYAYEVNRIRSNHLMQIDRIFPDLDVIPTYIQFPSNLYRISQFRYPNGEQISFGDMSRKSSKEPYFEYELAYQRAKARGFTVLAEDLGGRLNYAIQEGLYDRSALHPYESLGMHIEPLQVLWQAASIEETPIFSELPRTDRIPFAGITLQRNPSSVDNENYGLMGFVGGAGHIHSHSSGMSMEIYGAGEVMGAKSGTGTYTTDIHEDYYRNFASNNTVITNGASRGEGNWINIGINTVQNVAMEPQSFDEPVSDHYSFSISSFVDDKGTLAEATQQRTLAIIRTSPSSGFYVDLFRSNSTVTNRTATTLSGPVTNQYHDYIFRNFGQPNIEMTLDGDPVSMSSQATRFANDIGDTYKSPGWRYFENTQVTQPVSGSLHARFTATVSGTTRHMDMHMPEVTNREYAKVDSPPIRDAPTPYASATAPTLVVRQIGEAWNNAFAAVYEPFFQNDGSTIRSVTSLKKAGVVCGVRVECEVDGETQIHHVMSFPNGNGSYEDATIGLSFTGRAGVATLLPNGTARLYVGDGNAMSYRGNTVSSTGGTTQFEGTFTPDEAPVIVSNSPVETTPAQLPQITTFAHNNDGIVTIQSTGVLGTPYRVQSSTTLQPNDWATVAEGVITESPFTIVLPGQNEPKNFYRIAMP